MGKMKNLPVDAICAEYEAGDSARTLGLKYDVSHETILRRLVDAGVLLRGWGAPDDSEEMQQAFAKAASNGLPIAHVARDFGVSANSLRTKLIRSGDYTPIREWSAWSDSDVAYVRAHYKVDLSAGQIGEALGRTRNEIIGKARRMGLCSPINSAAAMEGNQLNKASAMRA